MAKERSSLLTNFEFKLINQFLGYNSESDKTEIDPRFYVRGSQNVYKKRSGTIANRPGQKIFDPADQTLAKVNATFSWQTSWGTNLLVRVANSKLQVYFNGAWQNLLTGLLKSRWVFDTWTDTVASKDMLLGACGDSNIYQWSGGLAILASATNAANAIQTIDAIKHGGSGYLVGDSVTITTGSDNAKATVLTTANGGLGSVSITLTEPASGYNTNDIVDLGGGSGSLKLTVDGSGYITAVAINTTGQGYYEGQQIDIPIKGNSNEVAATIQINTVLNGTITEVIVTNPGSGYSIGTGNATTTTGSGTGLTIDILAVAAYSITKTNPTSSFQQSGFEANDPGKKVLIINGHIYSYLGGEANSSLIGLSADPSSEPVGSIIIQVVITITPGTSAALSNTYPLIGNNNDFIRTVNNQVYVGSYSSRNIYISSNADYTNYTVPTTILVGDPDIAVLREPCTGIGVRNGQAYAGGINTWYPIIQSQITVGSVIQVSLTAGPLPAAPLAGPLAHEFIETIGNNLIYLSQDQQLRTFGDFKNLFVPAYPSLSLNLYSELTEQNFTGGHLRSIGEFIYITAPVAGITYLYQVRQTVNTAGNVVTERIWHSPFVWNVSRIESYLGKEYGFSNANPQMYQLWNTGQWHDDSPSGQPIQYVSLLAMAYQNYRRQGLSYMDKVYLEGYLVPGSKIYLRVLYDYQGSRKIVNAIVNSTKSPAKQYIQATDASLGQTPLGGNPLGIGLPFSNDPQDLVPKFRCIRSVAIDNFFENQLIVYTQDLDARFEILCLGTDVRVNTEQQATFIINRGQN